MPIAEGLAAISPLKSLYELIQKIRNSDDPDMLRNAASEMVDLALSARAQTAALQEERNAAVIELAALKAEIEQSNRFDEEAKNYARVTTHTGATVYREKDASGIKADSPYFCPNCFANKHLSMLNPAPDANTKLGVFAHNCGRCDRATRLPKIGYVEPPPTTPRIADGVGRYDPFGRV